MMMMMMMTTMMVMMMMMMMINVIRQGLPMIAAAGADAGYAEVRKQNICPFHLGQLINYQGKLEKALFFFTSSTKKLEESCENL